MATKNFKHLQAALAEKPDYDKRAVAAEHAVLEEIRTYDRTLAEIRKARSSMGQMRGLRPGWRRPRWYGRGAARGRRRVSDMWDLDGWAEVSCHERDGMQDDMLRPISSLTDPEGEFGSPIIFTEWGFNDDHPVIRDYRVPGEGCTHYVNEAPR